MMHWLAELQRMLTHGKNAVLVTVAHVEGSAPRDAGTRMLVTREASVDTIGGGHLEWRAIDVARQVLRDGGYRTPRRLERFALGPSLGQCCGGVVTLAFEHLTVADLGWVAGLAKRLAARQPVVRSVSFGAPADPVMLSAPEPGTDRTDCLLWDGAGLGESGPLLTETIVADAFPVVLFGAGHVGAALVRVLGTLSCRVLWVDERDAQFPRAVPGNVTTEASDVPEAAVDAADPGSYFLVMTHSHALDQALAERILLRGDSAYFGLIGSRTKRRQFEHRLTARGIDTARLARMICPIGVPGITGKAPETIAIAVAAQLLQTVEARAARPVGATP
jgi:xanthine dehydrogenase accessory factor